MRGGKKNSEVVFPTSDVEKFISEVDFSISELFFRLSSPRAIGGADGCPDGVCLPIYQHPMGVPFGGVPLCRLCTVGSPSLRAVSRYGY